MTWLGNDTDCVTDIPLVDRQVTSPALLVGQRIARMLQTPRGALGLIGDDPDRGWDVRQYVNAKLTSAIITTAQQQITNECLKDEAVESADVTMNFNQGIITITISLVTSAGPLTMTMNVSQLTTTAVFNF